MGRSVKYKPLEERLRDEQDEKDRKAEKAAKVAEAKERAATRKDEKAKRDGIGLGASLQRVADKHEVIQAARDDHSGSVAEYLKPYLKKLNALELSIKEFPHNATIPWADIESEVLDPTSPENIIEVGTRFGVEKKMLYLVSRNRKWTRRRAIIMELHSRASTVRAIAGASHAMVGGSGEPGESVVEDEELLVGLVQECLRQINVSLEQGHIPFRSAGDIDKIVRLLLVVQGKADSIRENRNEMTPAVMETIAAKVAKNLKIAPALAGLVVIEPSITDAEFEVKSEPLTKDWAPEESDVVEEGIAR